MIYKKRLIISIIVLGLIAVGVWYTVNKKHIGADVVTTSYQVPQNYLEVYGKVLDKNNQPLPNITITAGTRETVSDNRGFYYLSFLRDDFIDSARAVESITVSFAATNEMGYAEVDRFEPTKINLPPIWRSSGVAVYALDTSTASTYAASELQQRQDFIIAPVQ